MDLKKILEKYFKDQVSEEALTEISTLFEAALNEKVKTALVEKETELEESNKTEMTKFKGDKTGMLILLLETDTSGATSVIYEEDGTLVNPSVVGNSFIFKFNSANTYRQILFLSGVTSTVTFTLEFTNVFIFLFV